MDLGAYGLGIEVFGVVQISLQVFFGFQRRLGQGKGGRGFRGLGIGCGVYPLRLI